jgi:N-acetylglucosaminyl-diphospho-decaprenol L-rhamnosyltransferase
MIAPHPTAPGSKLTLSDLGAVVLAYGQGNQHVPLIETLSAAGIRDEHVVVVHNPDRPPDSWSPAYPREGTLLAQDRNTGYAAAMNRGIRYLRERGYSAALLLTHDTRLKPDTITELVKAANAEPDCGVLGLAIVGAGGASISYGSLMRRDGIIEHINKRPAGGLVADVPFVDGSALFIRLAACQDDPLPERYFMYFEEGELCGATRRRGWRVAVALYAKASSVSGIRNRTLAFTYLYTRNGLDWTLRYRGKLAALRFAGLELGRAWKDAPRPDRRGFSRFSARDAGFQQLIARLLGLADFVRGRWGPPPERVLRMSDVRNT